MTFDYSVLTWAAVVMAAEYTGVALACVADLLSGVRRARRGGEACSSRGLRRTVSKLTGYYLLLFCLSVVDGMTMAAVLSLQAMGHSTIAPFPWLTSAGALSEALIEVKSIVENSPQRVSLIEALRFLLGLLKSRAR